MQYNFDEMNKISDQNNKTTNEEQNQEKAFS
jgi:hypothetical protein